jgi:hypothetical protein
MFLSNNCWLCTTSEFTELRNFECNLNERFQYNLLTRNKKMRINTKLYKKIKYSFKSFTCASNSYFVESFS